MKHVKVNTKLLDFIAWFDAEVGEFDMIARDLCLAGWVMKRAGARLDDNYTAVAAGEVGLSVDDADMLFHPWKGRTEDGPNPYWDSELTCDKSAALRVMGRLAV